MLIVIFFIAVGADGGEEENQWRARMWMYVGGSVTMGYNTIVESEYNLSFSIIFVTSDSYRTVSNGMHVILVKIYFSFSQLKLL